MERTPADQYFNSPRLEALVEAFRTRFDGHDPAVVVRVPGRVNLIGEHIDYCGYAVHPMAIQQDVLVALGPSTTSTLTLKNADMEKYEDSQHDLAQTVEVMKGSPPDWWNYFLCGVKGILEEVVGGTGKGFNALVDGGIPPSAGLSSSSALVVSAAISK